VLAVLALTLAACGGSATKPSPAPSRASGVDGIVLFGGGPFDASLSPSPLPGGFGSGAQGRPYRFAIQAFSSVSRRTADATPSMVAHSPHDTADVASVRMTREWWEVQPPQTCRGLALTLDRVTLLATTRAR